MFERLTPELRALIPAAATLAAEAGAAKAGPADLLRALVADESGAGARILAGYGVTAETLRPPARRAGLTEEEISALRGVGIDAEEVFRRLEETFGPGALEEPATPQAAHRRGRIGGPFDAPARKVIELSLREAIALGEKRISSAHLLLALLRHGVDEPLASALTAHGVSYDSVRLGLRQAA